MRSVELVGERFELDLPAVADYLAVVRSVVTSAAEAASKLPPSRVDDLRLAVTEACANAFDASRRVNGSGRVQVRCDLDSTKVVVEVHDTGGGFDPETVVPPPPITGPDRLKFERGLGIPLMRVLADEVDFRREGDGTTVRLVLRTQRPRPS